MSKPRHPSQWRFNMLHESDIEGYEPIPDTDGFYRINRIGKVISRRRRELIPWPEWWIAMSANRSREEKPINRVHIVRADGNTCLEHIGQLVLETFIGPRPSPQHHAIHLNGVTDDDSLNNLKWATVTERMHHTIASGRLPCGEKKSNSKYSDRQRAAMRKIIKSGVPVNLLAAAIGIPQPRLREIATYGDKMDTYQTINSGTEAKG